MEYERLLARAYEALKPVAKAAVGRFVVPEAKSFIQGKRTVITNFAKLCSELRRPVPHLAKFLFRELAVSGGVEAERLILNRRLDSETINKKVDRYVKEYVFCRECGKPDTELVKEHRLTFVQCLACGAKRSVPKL